MEEDDLTAIPRGKISELKNLIIELADDGYSLAITKADLDFFHKRPAFVFEVVFEDIPGKHQFYIQRQKKGSYRYIYDSPAMRTPYICKNAFEFIYNIKNHFLIGEKPPEDFEETLMEIIRENMAWKA